MRLLKVTLILLTSVIIYGVTSFQGVKAETTTVVWTMDTTNTEHALNGNFEFTQFVTEMIVLIPHDEANGHLVDNGTYEFTWNFYNAADVLVDTLDSYDVFGDSEGANWYYDYEFHINFDVLDIDSTARKIEIILPQAYTDSNPADVGYLDYMNDNTVVSLSTSSIPYGLFRFFAEANGDGYYDTHWLHGDIQPLEVGTEYISLIPAFSLTDRIFGDESILYFYDDLYNVIGSRVIYPYPTYFDDTSYIGYNVPIADLDDYDDFAYFSFKAAIWLYTPSKLLIYNNSLIYTFDGNVLDVNFYSEQEIVYTHKTVLGGRARYPIFKPTKEGEIFSHWITANGVEYNWTAISEDMLIGNDVNFYAVFEVVPDDIAISVIDPTADEDSLITGLLTNLGFNDPISRTIVFGFVAVITAGLMLFKGISIMATVVVVGCELFFFMYLGLIPMFVSIMIILVLVFVGWGYRSGGASHE